MKCVDELADLVGLDSPARANLNWAMIESSIDRSLPDDYKHLVERFPNGRFQNFLRLIRPVRSGLEWTDYLGHYSHRLEDMRRWRRGEPRRFPFPIFPEDGGLLPWGETHRGDLLFWLTDAADPNRWPVVVGDIDFAEWQKIDTTSCGFLMKVVKGEFDASRFGRDLGAEPCFRAAVSDRASPPVTGPEYWIRQHVVPSVPENKFAQLAQLLGRPSKVPKSIDWASVRDELGIPLPQDYINFVDTYGPGALGDIDIAAPHYPSGYSLLAFLNRHFREIALARQRGTWSHPVYPEPGGMITWGMIDREISFGWAQSANDAELWGIVVADSAGNLEYRYDRSFSSFLVEYVQLEAPNPITLSSRARPEPMVFNPQTSSI